MNLTTHIGYGTFRLQDFEPGEYFARFDGSLAQVCESQPYREHMPNHVQVRVDRHGANDRKIMLHRTAQAHAVSLDEAKAVQVRKDRKAEDDDS